MPPVLTFNSLPARFCALALALLGCASALVRVAGPPPRSYVLLAPNTVLRASRSATAPATRTAAGAPTAWRLLSERGERLRVESVAPTAARRHCVSLDGHPPERQRYWVDASSRVTVLIRDVTVSFDAVSSLRASAGTPASVTAEGGVTLDLDGVRVTSRVPADAVGTTYSATTVLRAPESSEQVTLREPVSLPDGGSVRAASGGAPGLMVERRRPWQGGSLATLGRRCLRVDAVIPTARIVPVMDIEFGGRPSR